MLDGGATSATIGAITLRDVAVTMTNKNREVHFRPVPSCNDFAAAVAAAEASTVSNDEPSTAATASQTPQQEGGAAGEVPHNDQDAAENSEQELAEAPGASKKADTNGAADDALEPDSEHATTASDSATEAPLATPGSVRPQPGAQKRAKQPHAGMVGRPGRLHVALGGVAVILALLLAALVYWRCCGNNSSQTAWEYTELVEHKVGHLSEPDVDGGDGTEGFYLATRARSRHNSVDTTLSMPSAA